MKIRFHKHQLSILARIYCAWLLLIIPDVLASPTINIKTDYYDINGHSFSKLRHEMAEKGPRTHGATQYGWWATTTWQVRYQVEYKTTRRGCIVDTAQTTVAIEFVYPRWIDHDYAPASIRQAWDRMYQALVRHEGIHAGHGISAAREIEKALPKLPPRNGVNGCDMIKRDVQARALEIVEKYKQEDILFDERTNHGANEGVVLPP